MINKYLCRFYKKFTNMKVIFILKQMIINLLFIEVKYFKKIINVIKKKILKI